MAGHCLLYYITDRRQFPGPEGDRRRRLLDKMAEAARCGVDWVQLREKDLSPRELEKLGREAVRVVRENSAGHLTRLLINARVDVAIAAGADGVHLPAGDMAASEARAIWAASLAATGASRKVAGNWDLETGNCLVGVSCHTLDEVRLAESRGADFAVFGPVFEKAGLANPAGLDLLRQACRHDAARAEVEGAGTSAMPILALGGVRLENAAACLAAGAAGVAAIRLFQQNDIRAVVEALGA